MESFYKNWLVKNKEENDNGKKVLNKIQKNIRNSSLSSATPSVSTSENRDIESEQTLSESEILPANPTVPSLQILSKIDTSNIVYENENLRLIIEQTDHIKQKKFRLQDHMFHIKILLKDAQKSPFLRDILQFLENAFEHILSKVRQFYRPEDHNIAFLTLYQEPMINGLNTGGFDLQESSTEIVERVLQMLEQFLVSNQSLKLNETFKVYLKVLSVDHIKYNKMKTPRNNPKRTAHFYKKHYGGKSTLSKKINFYWALDIPDSYPNSPIPDVFKNKCLLTCTVLGLLQNEYFKSSRVDKRFVHVQNINSINKVKKNHAGKILLEELNLLLEKTKLPNYGPYNLVETTKILSEKFNCQFFIFDGMDNSNKLIHMFPEEFNDSLQPIYLFQPHEAPNHVVFIRNLKSYFKANVKVCFGCKKFFQTYNYRHLCPKKTCCFSCRRFFASESTYLHEKIISEFCDKNISLEKEFLCIRCNVTCYSLNCSQAHKLICCGQGSFGFKCLKCNKFTYRHGKISGTDLKNMHVCGEDKSCLYCRELKSENHLCKLQKETFVKSNVKLAFIGMEFVDHLTEPILAIIYRENKKGFFSKYEFNAFQCEPCLQISTNFFQYSSKENFTSADNNKEKLKMTQDFRTNSTNLQNKIASELSDKILQLIISLEWQNTTFICQDENSMIYVSEVLLFVNHLFYMQIANFACE